MLCFCASFGLCYNFIFTSSYYTTQAYKQKTLQQANANKQKILIRNFKLRNLMWAIVNVKDFQITIFSYGQLLRKFLHLHHVSLSPQSSSHCCSLEKALTVEGNSANKGVPSDFEMNSTHNTLHRRCIDDFK